MSNVEILAEISRLNKRIDNAQANRQSVLFLEAARKRLVAELEDRLPTGPGAA